MPGKAVIAQKRSFLASEAGIDLSIYFQKKSAEAFGGEGFITQKRSGKGTAFLEIDGSAVECNLAAGESLIIDTGYLVAMDESCSFDIQAVKGLKNVFSGGEGLFNTILRFYASSE